MSIDVTVVIADKIRALRSQTRQNTDDILERALTLLEAQLGEPGLPAPLGNKASTTKPTKVKETKPTASPGDGRHGPTIGKKTPSTRRADPKNRQQPDASNTKPSGVQGNWDF